MLVPTAMVKKIAYLRSPNVDAILQKTGFLDEIEVLRPHFALQGAELLAVDWQYKGVPWNDFAFVIPKNVWDYFDHYRKFYNWMDMLSQQGVVFKNNQKLIRWNSDKHYLAELQNKGAAVAPLRLITKSQELDSIKTDIHTHGRILLKPAISGGGKNTQVYGASDWIQCQVDAREILKNCALIVQPYIEEIADGEWSFFFFREAFSHAILKKPKSGDFRAHSLFGAENLATTPSAAQIAEARRFLDFIPGETHYSRVDGVVVNGKLLLIELELIEPYLYFECAPPTAPALFAKALLA